MTQFAGVLGAGLFGDIVGVMLINVPTIMYMLAGVVVLAVAARGLKTMAAQDVT